MISSDEAIMLPSAHRSRRVTTILVMVLLAIILSLGVVTYAVFTVSQDRNGWRDVADDFKRQNIELQSQLSDQTAELACRSRANFQTVKATAEVIKIISALVDASGQQQQTDEIRTQLGPANAALDAAIAAQDAAIPDSTSTVSACTPTTGGNPP